MNAKEFNALRLQKKVEFILELLGDQKPGVANSLIFKYFHIDFMAAFLTGTIWNAKAYNYPKEIPGDEIEKKLKEGQFVYKNYDNTGC